jgi:hypothetical protein
MSAISSVMTNALEAAVGGIKSPTGLPPAQRPTSGSEITAIGQAAAPVAYRLLGAPLDLQNLAKAQASCQQTQSISSSLVEQPLQQGAHTILCDVSRGTARPLVPLSQRKDVFKALHNISHPGIIASKRLISSRFVLKGMAKDITA